MTPLEELLAKLPDAKRAGIGWTAKCPVHDDPGQSLSILPGKNGATIVECRDGCRTASICEKLALPAALLGPLKSTELTQQRGKEEYRRKNESQPSCDLRRFEPFPLESLPEPVRSFVARGAKAIGCDPSFLALPLLTALGAAIGNTRRLRIKRGWTVPTILWTAIVGESGTAKTPAFDLVMKPILNRQRNALERYEKEFEQYKDAKACWEKEIHKWKQRKDSNDSPPKEPEVPQAKRSVVSDTTVEALAPLILANPRGLLLCHDELAAWFGSFDRYTNGKGGSDSSNWLDMFSGNKTIIVDRKTGERRTIFVSQASIWICGGIQPAILNRALGTEHRESGLAARLLLACPPRKAKKWTEADIDPRDEAAIDSLYSRLFDLAMIGGCEDELRPLEIGMTTAAKRIWIQYYNDHNEEQVDLAGGLAAAWSKLEEYAPRLALIIHYARWAADDPSLADESVLDETSMRSGIQLATWFKKETRRVYALLAEGEEHRDHRRLLEWIDRKREPVTARQVQQSCSWLKESTAVAEAALQALVKAGLGYWQSSPSGKAGQPTRRFVLHVVNGNRVKPKQPDETVDGGDREGWGIL